MNTTTEKQYRVSLNGDEKTLPQSEVMAYADELFAKHGGRPSIEPLVEVGVPILLGSAAVGNTPGERGIAAAKADARADAREAAKKNSTFDGGLVTDDAAKARIEGMHETLRAAGVSGLEKKGDKAGGQLYATGTRMADVGYENQAARYKEHEGKASLRDCAAEFSERVRREERVDVVVTTGEVGRSLQVNGKVTVLDGLALGEQAIRGLAHRMGSPMTRYVMGLRNRIAEQAGELRVLRANVKNGTLAMDAGTKARAEALLAGVQEDKREIGRVVRFECERCPDEPIKLRTRRGLMDVFAGVSPTYGVADAPEVMGQVLDELPADAKGSYSYDPATTGWELRAHVWTPVPVVEQAVGEPFEGYASFKSRDNGTRPLGGGGGIVLLACLNAGTYTADGESATRAHRSGILEDLDEVVAKAVASISIFATALGDARRSVVEVPSGLTIEDAIPGFWMHLLRGGRGKELAGVLPGRKAENAKRLTAAYFDQRRDPERIVRSDFAQAWTRLIQDEEPGVRREGEDAVGAWLVKPRKMVCEAEGQDDEELASV